MTTKFSFHDHLYPQCKPGGGSALTVVTELQPAGGEHATVAPAQYVDGRGNATFAFETRYISGQPMLVVIVDSKQSVSNRDESAVVQARNDESSPGYQLLSKVPTIRVTYENAGKSFTDLDLPARGFDGHIQAGRIEGVPATHHDSYRAVRDSSQADASAVFNTAPTMALLGGWDSRRKANQARFRTILSGEVIGVTAKQTDSDHKSPTRGAGRADSVSPSVKLDGKNLDRLLKDQEAELSDKNIAKLQNQSKQTKDKPISLAGLGLGNIPPRVDQNLGGVACSRIIRTRVLSFSALRQLRFGGDAESDAAHRAVLAAYGLLASALSAQELVLRANCDLIEAAAPQVSLDKRYGQSEEFAPIEVDDAVELLEQALENLKTVAGIDWDGQVLDVVGDPSIIASATDEDPEEEA
ncbi:type I-G CRISPR-associated protein Cas7 [Rothia uropygioeca]|uniref:type I-G CRISPR-associated protein Cas7 n=1 Tax=Kocuria sp. 257 TaxID=2021970 RepID=UPI001010C1E3|nr:type I-U CRISPR-associated protein Cas7 [Kocuria sp. 257]